MIDILVFPPSGQAERKQDLGGIKENMQKYLKEVEYVEHLKLRYSVVNGVSTLYSIWMDEMGACRSNQVLNEHFKKRKIYGTVFACKYEFKDVIDENGEEDEIQVAMPLLDIDIPLIKFLVANSC